MPQGSVLGPHLFIIYLIIDVNDLGLNVHGAGLHFYADDTVVYHCELTPVQAVDAIQFSLLLLKLVLNADKT